MLSLKSTVLAAALVAIAHADYRIDPETVSEGTRGEFCPSTPQISMHVLTIAN